MNLNPKNIPCARCGSTATGVAFIGEDRLCHDDDQHPTCYELEQWDRTKERLADRLLAGWGFGRD